jgi:hypothetical protein
MKGDRWLLALAISVAVFISLAIYPGKPSDVEDQLGWMEFASLVHLQHHYC